MTDKIIKWLSTIAKMTEFTVTKMNEFTAAKMIEFTVAKWFTKS
jgi:hypothetical protein